VSGSSLHPANPGDALGGPAPRGTATAAAVAGPSSPTLPTQVPSLPAPDVLPVPVRFKAEVFASGLNGALRRLPRVETRSISIGSASVRTVGGKLLWPRVKTRGVTFPDGFDFLPETQPAESAELGQLKGPDPSGTEVNPLPVGRAREKKRPTRLKPPADALSLEDRWFYVLQPPLETLLGGQELIMPFEPFGFQYEGIGWLFSQKAALLADEMGLGKTMQSITAMRLLLRSGRVRSVLLVCPKPLIPNWQREFKLWAEELPVITIEGDAARRRMLWTMPNAPVRIANYELLVRDFQMLGPDEFPQFDLVVLDEAQRIKNRDSLTAETARAIRRRRAWALTGTPIENRPEELVSLLEFMEVVPPRASLDLRQLRRLSEEHILRRTKDLVLTDLPPRLDRDEYLDLAPAQQYAYQVAEKEGVIQLNDMGDAVTIQHVFELILRLKQITNFDPLTGESAKLDRLSSEMEEIASSGCKAILFSQWTRCLDWLQARLRHFGALIYHGGIPAGERERVLKRFREDPDCHLLLMSYGVGAVGLNLQFAQYVFLFDRWWNPAVEDQAINRAHRIGQKSAVIVTRFISRNTIEERIDRVLKQKRKLFEEILGPGARSNVSLSLTAAEIFGLFDLKTRQAPASEKSGPASTIAPAGRSGPNAA